MGTRTTFSHVHRILLAEDDAELRRMLAYALRGDGYEIVEAQDGLELVKLLAQSIADPPVADGFDLVISDIRMPRWSGLEVLAALRPNNRMPPVVLITAFGDEEVLEKAERLGAVALLDKPFDVDRLRSIVATLDTGI